LLIMKNVLLLVFLCLSFSMRSNASHMMGGQITVSHVYGMNYKVIYTAYRDVSGVSISPIATLTFVNAATSTTFTVDIQYDPNVIVLVPGVEEYRY